MDETDVFARHLKVKAKKALKGEQSRKSSFSKAVTPGEMAATHPSLGRLNRWEFAACPVPDKAKRGGSIKVLPICNPEVLKHKTSPKCRQLARRDKYHLLTAAGPEGSKLE